MKKILFVLADMEIGGVQRSVLPLLCAASRRWDVTLRLFSDSGELMDQIPECVHVEVETSMARAERLRHMISAQLQKFGTGRLFSAAKKIYHRIGNAFVPFSQDIERFDVAIAYQDGLPTWYVAQNINANKKIAFVHTDFLAAGYNSIQENAIYHSFSKVYFSSELALQHFCSVVHIPMKKTAIIHNCIDGTAMKEQAQQPGFMDDFSGLRILTVGRLSHEKGLDKVNKLLYWLRNDGFDVRWYLIGDGPERDLLLHQAKEYCLTDSLFLMGKKSNPYPFFAQCDIYVQPSNYESYCIALAEARYFKRPILTCDFAGAREQLSDGRNGYIVPFEAEAMYPKLKELVQNRERREIFQKALQEERNLHNAYSIEILFKDLCSE